MPWKAWHSSQQCRGGHQVSESEIQLCWSSSWCCWYHHLSNQKKEDMWCRNHPNDPPEQLDVAEMTNVFATNVGGTCAATQVTNQQHSHLLPRFILKQTKIILKQTHSPHQAFLPLLRKSSLPRVLSISSFLGSISRWIFHLNIYQIFHLNIYQIFHKHLLFPHVESSPSSHWFWSCSVILNLTLLYIFPILTQSMASLRIISSLRNLPNESNFYMATSYRCSKSALNQLIKCFSLDIPEVSV